MSSKALALLALVSAAVPTVLATPALTASNSTIATLAAREPSSQHTWPAFVYCDSSAPTGAKCYRDISTVGCYSFPNNAFFPIVIFDPKLKCTVYGTTGCMETPFKKKNGVIHGVEGRFDGRSDPRGKKHGVESVGSIIC